LYATECQKFLAFGKECRPDYYTEVILLSTSCYMLGLKSLYSSTLTIYKPLDYNSYEFIEITNTLGAMTVGMTTLRHKNTEQNNIKYDSQHTNIKCNNQCNSTEWDTQHNNIKYDTQYIDGKFNIQTCNRKCDTQHNNRKWDTQKNNKNEILRITITNTYPS